MNSLPAPLEEVLVTVLVAALALGALLWYFLRQKQPHS
jgi:uncharacterized protein HemX